MRDGSVAVTVNAHTIANRTYLEVIRYHHWSPARVFGLGSLAVATFSNALFPRL
jgi:hypothetical protein